MSTIRSAVEESQDALARYYSVLTGTVVDVSDPRGLHRVRAIIPGLCEPFTSWLLPLTAGGGSAQRGGHLAPVVGSTVAVWFLGGDPQGIGVYMGLHWGAPNSGSEVPDALLGVDPADASKIQALEVAGFVIAIDERGGKRQLAIYDRTLGSLIQVNGELGEIAISGTVTVRIEAPRVAITGAEVTINDRQVLASSAPI